MDDHGSPSVEFQSVDDSQQFEDLTVGRLTELAENHPSVYESYMRSGRTVATRAEVLLNSLKDALTGTEDSRSAHHQELDQDKAKAIAHGIGTLLAEDHLDADGALVDELSNTDVGFHARLDLATVEMEDLPVVYATFLTELCPTTFVTERCLKIPAYIAPGSHREEFCLKDPTDLISASFSPAARCVLEAAYWISTLATAINENRDLAVALYVGTENYQRVERQIQDEIDLLAAAIAYDRSHPNDALPDPDRSTSERGGAEKETPPNETSEADEGNLEDALAEESGSSEKDASRDAEMAYLDALEATYVNAKNGAVSVGDQSTAAKFFVKEKVYARKRHWQRISAPRHADTDGFVSSARARLRGAWDWMANGLFSLVAGYGEKPGRVFLSSVAVVLLSAVVYWVRMDWYQVQVLSEPPIRPYEYQQLQDVQILGVHLGNVQIVEYLILSLEAFVTLVLVGPGDKTLGPLTHLVAEVEGFLGVFLVALFVFTLTRSVHR